MRADFICKNEEFIPDLARMGMTWCSIGIEGSQRMLDFYNKKETTEEIIKACEILHKNKVNIFGNYILGAPTETKEDIDELFEIVKKIKPQHHSASLYTSYPGSVLYDYCEKNHLFVGDGSSENDHYSMTRHPYERKIVGVDYDYIRQRISEFVQYKSPVVKYGESVSFVAPKKFSGFELVEIPPNNDSPKVSIILLSHNRPKFLQEAIDSIKAQTMSQWELIIIDDFSTVPGVVEVLKNAAASDNRIHMFRTNYDVDNIGLLWNRGIDISKGKYIALLDDDNRKKPDFCKEMSEYLDTHQEVNAVACFNQLFHEKDSKNPGKPSIFDSPKNLSKASILKGNHVDSGCMMFRRDLIDEIGWFDETIKTQEDWDYVIRIVHNSKKGFGVIQKPLAEYRWHAENRLYRSRELGFVEDERIILKKKRGALYRILLFHQETNKITLSQNNVLRGVKNALKAIKWAQVEFCSVNGISSIKGDYDLVFIFMPFSLSIDDIRKAKSKGIKTASFHCEDPQAIELNLQRTSLMDYIFTNDISAKDRYKSAFPNILCGYCPCVSVDDIGLTFRDNIKKVRDVIFYGYAYDSRVDFLKKFCSKYNIKMSIVGGGWKEKAKGIRGEIIGELSEQDSIRVMEESKIVVLMNRQNTDLGGKLESEQPQSVVRGYFECASGSLIMLDDKRPHHSFDHDIVLYSDIDDLYEKIRYYLSSGKAKEERESIAARGKQRALTEFTYRKRIHDMINAIRSTRIFYRVK